MENTTFLKIGNIEIYWLHGGDFRLDGGSMFGAVPKMLWQGVYPADGDNTIPLCNDPLLLKTDNDLVIVDTGLGNRLDERIRKIYKIGRSWQLLDDLEKLGFNREDITRVVLTHCDFDHAGGITMAGAGGREELTFPGAVHYIREKEWQDVNKPHPRALSTYFPENFLLLAQKGKLRLLQGDGEISPGVTVRHTGGHTRGHQMVEIESQGNLGVHLGDLYPTHAHSNPLWIMAYDNYPLEVIDCKLKLFSKYMRRDSYFIFYHDPFVRACKLADDFSIKERWTDTS